ncbi:hypothetical protein ACFV5N_05505 [Streptomyces sp. NPDC059853]|uniref:hypothetical protein n=1 Tax=Streptomyces sp. NPDC059853 TaxID=3346973 RepID=UPI0036674774
MIKEQALLESRTLRENTRGRTEVLDKVKALALLPDGLHVTTEIVAEYFVVHRDAIKTLVRRHRDERAESGLTVLRGSDLQEFEGVKMTPSNSSYPQAMRRNLTLYTRRTVLTIAMLLRDSAVAREVRAYLLDAVEGNTAAGADLEQRVTAIEGVLAGIGPALRDVALVVHRMDDRLRRVETGWWTWGPDWWMSGRASTMSGPSSQRSRPGWRPWGPGWRTPSTSSPG